MGKELKFVTSTFQANLTNVLTTANADPAGGSLIPIVQGAGQSQRVGRVVFPKSIYINGRLGIDGTNNNNMGQFYVTFWLVEDKQTNGAQMAPGNFLEATGSTIAAEAFQNLEYSDRFRLLKKKIVRFNRQMVANDTLSTFEGGVDIQFNMYKQLPKSAKVQYTDVGSDISNIATHSYHLLAVKSHHAPSIEFSYNVRARYTD